METRVSLAPVWFDPDKNVLELKGKALRIVAGDGSVFDRIVKLVTNESADGAQKFSLMVEDPKESRRPRYLTREALEMIGPSNEGNVDYILNLSRPP